MTFEEFQKSYEGNEPPVCLSLELKSLWFSAKNDWNKAHELIQHETGMRCALVHAYLHRLEGDVGNADYWYSKAGTVRPMVSSDEEFKLLVKTLM